MKTSLFLMQHNLQLFMSTEQVSLNTNRVDDEDFGGLNVPHGRLMHRSYVVECRCGHKVNLARSNDEDWMVTRQMTEDGQMTRARTNEPLCQHWTRIAVGFIL